MTKSVKKTFSPLSCIWGLLVGVGLGLITPSFFMEEQGAIVDPLNRITVSPCFTPGGQCTQHIVQAIQRAEKEILVQVYSFTSQPILYALARAKKKGIDVKVISDRSQIKAYGHPLAFLEGHKIPIFIDHKPAIAHNKVMIIDQKKVFTGSFNFTKAAQHRNTENSVLIQSVAIAYQYRQDWLKRQRESVKLAHYIPKKKDSKKPSLKQTPQRPGSLRANTKCHK